MSALLIPWYLPKGRNFSVLQGCGLGDTHPELAKPPPRNLNNTEVLKCPIVFAEEDVEVGLSQFRICFAAPSVMISLMGYAFKEVIRIACSCQNEHSWYLDALAKNHFTCSKREPERIITTSLRVKLCSVFPSGQNSGHRHDFQEARALPCPLGVGQH